MTESNKLLTLFANIFNVSFIHCQVLRVTGIVTVNLRWSFKKDYE